LGLAHGDAMISKSRNQVFHGQRVLAILGVLFILAGTVATGVLYVRGARLAVLQCIVGNVGDEFLGGDGDETHYLRVHGGEASLEEE